MADFGAPVVNAGTALNPMQTLSQVLNIKTQQQNLQQQTAAAYQAQQDARDRQAISQVDLKGFLDKGDVDGAQKAVLAVAPSPYGLEVASRTGQAMQNAIATKSAANKLNQEYLNPVRAAAGAWAADPNAQLPDLAKQLEVVRDTVPKEAQGQVSDLITNTLKGLAFPDVLSGNPKDLATQKSHALAFSRAGLGPSEVGGPAGLSTPVTGTVIGPTGEITGTAQNRTTGQVSPTSGGVQLGLSPAQLASTITLPNGQITTLGAFLGKSGIGGAKPSAANIPAAAPQKPRTAQDDMPPANAPSVVQKAYANAVTGANAHVEEVRHNDSDYGVNRHINQQILRLSDSTDTGPGTATWHHALGAIAGPFGGNNVADYQTIGAYLDRQAALSTRQMGLPDTNAGLATAASLSGTPEYQKNALQTKVKLTDALVEGAHQYRMGLDKVAGASGQASPKAVQQYRSAWAANFDPTVFMYKNADKTERKVIASHLSPDQAAALKQKAQNLDALSQGNVPQ